MNKQEIERFMILLDRQRINELQENLIKYKQKIYGYKLDLKKLKKKYKNNLVLPEIYANNKYLYKEYIKENKQKLKLIKKELNKIHYLD